MTTLENLPPETWADILDTACLDDGSTARSLSLVSRQIHHVSRSHLYYTVKVDSVSQLLKLDDQISKSIPGSMKGDGYFLKTQFLCISLPTPLFSEVYPEESFVPRHDPDDTPYRPSDDSPDSDDDNSWYTTDLSDADSDSAKDGASSYQEEDEEDGEDEQNFKEELEAELADITNDPACKNLGSVRISSLSELLNYPNFSLEGYIYRVYSAVRRLLDACASTLEVFSLYFLPWKLLSPDLFIPPLPKLHRLSIYIPGGCKWVECTAHPQTLFPSLKVLRMVDDFTIWFSESQLAWWADIVKSCPSDNLQIVTAKEVPRFVHPTPTKSRAPFS
jgi:hypothetical protein